jgi:hypothetical protein
VHAIDSTHFDEKASGYMRLDVMTSGQVRMAVHLIDQAGGEHVAYTEIWR